jgi:hypothetical protein
VSEPERRRTSDRSGLLGPTGDTTNERAQPDPSEALFFFVRGHLVISSFGVLDEAIKQNTIFH